MVRRLPRFLWWREWSRSWRQPRRQRVRWIWGRGVLAWECRINNHTASRIRNSMLKKYSALLLLTFFALAIYAQQLGILRGTVTDESGALVPGAKVTVSNAAGPVKSAVSGDDGSYSIAGIPPGKYTVTAAASGLVQFQPATLDISNGGTATLNLKLRVSLEKQEVTVQENVGPTVSTDPSQNAGALVLRGTDLDALSDDPDDLQSDLQALAGPSAGPRGGQIYIDGFTGG